jgi:hypothetical protein
MEWTQFLILIVTMGGLFFWNRSEARADARKADEETKTLRRELIDAMRSIEAEFKDFHGRLCAIEERNRK